MGGAGDTTPRGRFIIDAIVALHELRTSWSPGQVSVIDGSDGIRRTDDTTLLQESFDLTPALARCSRTRTWSVDGAAVILPEDQVTDTRLLCIVVASSGVRGEALVPADGTTRFIAGAYHPLHDPVTPMPNAVTDALQACRLDVFGEAEA